MFISMCILLFYLSTLATDFIWIVEYRVFPKSKLIPFSNSIQPCHIIKTVTKFREIKIKQYYIVSFEFKGIMFWKGFEEPKQEQKFSLKAIFCRESVTSVSFILWDCFVKFYINTPKSLPSCNHWSLNISSKLSFTVNLQIYNKLLSSL